MNNYMLGQEYEPATPVDGQDYEENFEKLTSEHMDQCNGCSLCEL